MGQGNAADTKSIRYKVRLFSGRFRPESVNDLLLFDLEHPTPCVTWSAPSTCHKSEQLFDDDEMTREEEKRSERARARGKMDSGRQKTERE